MKKIFLEKLLSQYIFLPYFFKFYVIAHQEIYPCHYSSKLFFKWLHILTAHMYKNIFQFPTLQNYKCCQFITFNNQLVHTF